MTELQDRVTRLEEGLQLYRSRVDSSAKEIKILFAEINIINDWVSDQFGVQLIDKNSVLLKTMHDYDQVEELSQTLSLLVAVRQDKRRLSLSKKQGNLDKTGDSDCDYSDYNRDDESNKCNESNNQHEDAEDEEEDEEHNLVIESDFAPKNPMNSKRPRRCTRKKISYKEITDEDAVKVTRETTTSPTSKRPYTRRKSDTDLTTKSTPEKQPKRGRPKKKPEDRIENWKLRLPMQCDECGKVLKGAGSLRVHKQIHANTRPYECNQCGKAFRMKHHLDFHILVHSGEKKETCSFCGKSFLVRRDLVRHERTHTGEKPFKCPHAQCTKSFNVKQHLTLHLRIHTGERPYQCTTCNKTFSQANSLRIHKKTHAKVEQGVAINEKTDTQSSSKERSSQEPVPSDISTVDDSDKKPSNQSESVVLNSSQLDRTNTDAVNEAWRLAVSGPMQINIPLNSVITTEIPAVAIPVQFRSPGPNEIQGVSAAFPIPRMFDQNIQFAPFGTPR